VTRAVVFAYSEVGFRCLQVLLAQGVEIPLLFTHADDPRESQWFGSVRDLAHNAGLRVETPDNPNTPEWIAAGGATNPDFVFSFYYRHMLKSGWLGVARHGALNMHGSLLPAYRGRAPVHWAILRGEKLTGASLHYMVEKPDAGALVDQQAVPILENDNALQVSIKVAGAAEAVMARSLPRLIDGSAARRPLDIVKGSYFGRRTPEDGRIDWRRSAREIHDLVRAVAPPFPGAFTEVNGCRLALWETRVDASPAQHLANAPCLYAGGDHWYADCEDGHRLQVLQLAVNGRLVAPNPAPPVLSDLPMRLS
jgi:methionyl-tRNA formyltransferase